MGGIYHTNLIEKCDVSWKLEMYGMSQYLWFDYVMLLLQLYDQVSAAKKHLITTIQFPQFLIQILYTMLILRI